MITSLTAISSPPKLTSIAQDYEWKRQPRLASILFKMIEEGGKDLVVDERQPIRVKERCQSVKGIFVANDKNFSIKTIF